MLDTSLVGEIEVHLVRVNTRIRILRDAAQKITLSVVIVDSS